MAELERRLGAAAPHYPFPDTPPLAAAARARLGELRPPRRGRLVLAFAVVLLAVAAGVLAAAAVAWLSEPGRQFMTFAVESWAEVKKVVWPTRKETMQTTGAVFAFVVVMAVFLWISDKALEWVLYDLIMGWKK